VELSKIDISYRGAPNLARFVSVSIWAFHGLILDSAKRRLLNEGLRMRISFVLPILMLCGCTTYYESGSMSLSPDVCHEERMLAELKQCRTLEDVVRIFKQKPECLCDSTTNGLLWAHWYYTKEAVEEGLFTTTYRWNGVYAHCKFREGALIGVTLPNLKWGDQESCVDNDWVCQKELVPKIQQHTDRLRGKAWYFNDEAHCYYYGDAGLEVDHWEGLNVHFKVCSVPSGHYRVWAVNSSGQKTYCDIPNGQEYLGFYDDKFHYRDPHDVVIAQAFAAGMNSAVNAITMQSNPSTPAFSQPTMQAAAHSEGDGRNRKQSVKSAVKTTSAARVVPRCEKHDCDRDALGHCPVCNAKVDMW